MGLSAFVRICLNCVKLGPGGESYVDKGILFAFPADG